MAENASQATKIPSEFPCKEYVIKAQVLAGGRGKGHFDNGFKVGIMNSLNCQRTVSLTSKILLLLLLS